MMNFISGGIPGQGGLPGVGGDAGAGGDGGMGLEQFTYFYCTSHEHRECDCGTVETSILPILLLTAMMLTPVSPRSAARELREIQGNLVTLEREEIRGWLDIKDRMGKRVKMDKMLRNSALCLLIK